MANNTKTGGQPSSIQIEGISTRGGYTTVDNELIFSEMSDKAFRIYCAFASYAFGGMATRPDKMVNPGLKTLADRLHRDEDSVSRTLPELETIGLVYHRRTGRSNKYTVYDTLPRNSAELTDRKSVFDTAKLRNSQQNGGEMPQNGGEIPQNCGIGYRKTAVSDTAKLRIEEYIDNNTNNNNTNTTTNTTELANANPDGGGAAFRDGDIDLPTTPNSSNPVGEAKPVGEKPKAKKFPAAPRPTPRDPLTLAEELYHEQHCRRASTTCPRHAYPPVQISIFAAWQSRVDSGELTEDDLRFAMKEAGMAKAGSAYSAMPSNVFIVNKMEKHHREAALRSPNGSQSTSQPDTQAYTQTVDLDISSFSVEDLFGKRIATPHVGYHAR